MSFQIAIKPTRRAAARLVADVRRRLQEAMAHENITQASIADKIGIGRSVINRQLKGRADLSLSRVGEIAEVLGYDADFVLAKRHDDQGNNAGTKTNVTVLAPVVVKSSGSVLELTQGYKKVSGAPRP